MCEQIRVVIADDHPVVRKGLRAMIEEDTGIKVTAEAGDGQVALSMIRDLLPDVAVLDIDMPRLDGFGVVKQLRALHIETPIVFLTLHSEEDLLRAALEMGCKGYLLKESAMQEIALAVRAVAAGQPYLSSALTSRLLQKEQGPAAQPAKSALDILTPVEQRILRLIADGKSSKEIGADLSIHYRTVENHRTNMCRKLNVEGAHALLRFALHQKGLS